MKEHLTNLLTKTVESLQKEGKLPALVNLPPFHVLHSRGDDHGDYSSNIALILAKPTGIKPRTLADLIKSHLHAPNVDKIEVADPGFINFFLKKDRLLAVIPKVLLEKERYGFSNKGKDEKILLEFVSANPTGPLHVGHGRGAAYGATLANLLKAVGCQVQTEYYVNDAGRQMDILATSIWLRYLELCGAKFDFPVNAYRGEYVIELANTLFKSQARALFQEPFAVFLNVPPDEPKGGDKETHIDGLIQNTLRLLKDQYAIVHTLGTQSILADIREDLTEFGVTFDKWFSEKSLLESRAVEKAIQKLSQTGLLYENAGALWFRSTQFGDEKDRVICKENGQHTYFATDIAYHLNKAERGFTKLINFFGADHHGYVPRIRASLNALGYQDPEFLTVLLVQFAILYRGKERVQMSSRSGTFVTLRELRKEVGNDAARFFYILRKSDQHLDFDLELAKSTSHENPVYYIQYAHARICSVFRKCQEQNDPFNPESTAQSLELLKEPAESQLLQDLERFGEQVEKAALSYQPQLLVHYLQELAGHFHAYYNAHKVLVEDPHLRQARLLLSSAVRQVLCNGLKILGVSAPLNM